MRMNRISSLVVGSAVILAAASASAQGPMPYGAPITLSQAKKVMAGAEAEAMKNKWAVVITILDSGGNVVMVQRLDDAQFGSIAVSKDKAFSAVAFRRPTKVFQDGLAKGGPNMRLLQLSGASTLEGGIPIVADGKVIGGIGVSGATGEQDAQVAKAGADSVK